MPFEGNEWAKELDFTALLFTQLRRYPSQLNMFKISKNLVSISSLGSKNSNFRMKKNPEAPIRRYLTIEMFFKITHNLQEKTCVRVFFR